jgi:hypothetical protein
MTPPSVGAPQSAPAASSEGEAFDLIPGRSIFWNGWLGHVVQVCKERHAARVRWTSGPENGLLSWLPWDLAHKYATADIVIFDPQQLTPPERC